MGIISYFIKKSDRKSYYQLLKKDFKNNYEKNFEVNLKYASMRKHFIQSLPNIESMEHANYSWILYLLEHFDNDKNIVKRDWKKFFFEDIQQKYFFNQYKYQNNAFYEEFLINKPKNKYDKTGEHFLESEPIVFPLSIDELKNYHDIRTKSNNFHNFDFRSNSKDDSNEEFLYDYSMDFDEVGEKINNKEYIYKYNSYIMRKYIRMIRKHIEKKDHPIHIVIDQFIFFFESFLKLNIDFCKNNQNEEKKCEEKGMEVVKEIQNFIEIMQVALKLFYSRSINFKYFKDEKDELINLISYILFNKKEFYKQLLDLFSYMNSRKKETLELQFKKSQKITPKELGIKARFCLDANSEECWKEFENKSKAKNKNFDKNSTDDETVSKEKKIN